MNNIWEPHEAFLKMFYVIFFLIMHDQLLYNNKHLLHDGWGNIKIYFAKKYYLSRGLRLRIIFVYIVSSYHFHTIAVKTPEFSRPIRWCLYRIIIFRHNVIYSGSFPLFYLEFNKHVFLSIWLIKTNKTNVLLCIISLITWPVRDVT